MSGIHSIVPDSGDSVSKERGHLVSRRRVLTIMGALAIPPLVDSAGNLLETLTAGFADYWKSADETRAQMLNPVSVTELGEFTNIANSPGLFSASDLHVKLSNGEKRVFKCTELLASANAYNVNLPSFDPLALLNLENYTDIVIAPVGYKVGNYHRGSIGTHNDVNFQYPALSTNGSKYGPDMLVDRFPGLGDELNEASGGYVIENSQIILTNKSGLERAMHDNIPFAQLVYYLDNNNYEQVLRQYWQNKFGNFPIGDTSYYYSMLVQIPVDRISDDWKTFILTSDTMVPISQMIQTIRMLSPDNRFKATLTDGGNGSSVLIKTSVDSEGNKDNLYSFGVNGFNVHYTPMELVFLKTQSNE